MIEQEERYVKIETNGNFPEELMLKLLQELGATPAFFEGEPQVRGRVFVITALHDCGAVDKYGPLLGPS